MRERRSVVDGEVCERDALESHAAGLADAIRRDSDACEGDAARMKRIEFFPERETSKFFPERETSKLFPARETSKVFFAIVVTLTACGTSAPASAPTTAPTASTPEVRAQVEEAPAPVDEEVSPSPSDRSLDEMDQSEIEAACMGGSTAACDRLGH